MATKCKDDREAKELQTHLQTEIKHPKEVIEAGVSLHNTERVEWKNIDSQNKNQFAEMQEKTTEFLDISKKIVIQETLPRDRDDNRDDLQETRFTWTIKGFKERMKHCKEDGDIFAESEEYSIASNGLKFKTQLWSDSDDEDDMIIDLHFTDKSSDESSKFLHSRKYVLVDQTNDTRKDDLVMIDEPRFGQNSAEWMSSECFSFHRFFPNKILQNCDKYVRNDEISLKIILEPIAMMYKAVASLDGNLILRVDNYSKRKQEAIDGIKRVITSESFYTSDKGFRLNMELYLNQGLGISIQPVLRIGEWDQLHSYPIVKINYKRLLMDQSDTQKQSHLSLEKPGCEYKIHDLFYQFEDFLLHEDAEKFPYFKDDSILLKFIIQTEL